MPCRDQDAAAARAQVASARGSVPRTLCRRAARPRWRLPAALPAGTGPRCSSTPTFRRQFWP